MSEQDQSGFQHAVVVLGTPVRADGSPSARLARRADRGIAIALAEPDALLVLTGGALRGRPAEAQVMGGLARAAGLPARRVLMEVQARSTLENALFTADIFPATARPLRISLVTDRLHAPRALMTFRSIGLTVDLALADWSPRDEGLAGWLLGLCYEAAAILWYGLRVTAGVHRRAARRGPDRS